MTCSQPWRWAVVLGMVTVISGCASSRSASLPASQAFPAEESQGARILRVGDDAAVVLHDGTEIKGRVREVSAGSVVLWRAGK